MRDDIREEDEVRCKRLAQEMHARVNSAAVGIGEGSGSRRKLPNDAIEDLTRTGDELFQQGDCYPGGLEASLFVAFVASCEIDYQVMILELLDVDA